jgi:hypothetical protein
VHLGEGGAGAVERRDAAPAASGRAANRPPPHALPRAPLPRPPPAAACAADDDAASDSGASIDSVESFPPARGGRAAARAAATGAARVLRPAGHGEAVPPCAAANVVVMELADLGSLRAALDAGEVVRCEGAPSRVDAAAAGQVLLDVASALRYLHGMRLVHGDVRVRARRRRRGGGRRAPGRACPVVRRAPTLEPPPSGAASSRLVPPLIPSPPPV